MGKIVKHCDACEESFAQKFGFCPNCGGALKAFEMNPVQEETKAATDKAAEATKVSESPKSVVPENNNSATAAIPSTGTYEISPKIQPAVVAAFSSNGGASNEKKASDAQPRVEKVISEEPTAKAQAVEISNPKNSSANGATVETKPLAAATATGASINDFQTANQSFQPPAKIRKNIADDAFHVTVIEEKNVGQRNLLLLGSMIFMLSLVFGGVVYSLFNKDLLIGAIDAGNPLYITPIDDVPMPVEEQPKPKNEKKAGGGGGGGNENPDEVTKGELPTQVPKPVAPLMMVTKMTNPDIKIVNQTQGTIVRPPTNEQVGLPKGSLSERLSSGSGIGGGFGDGRGSGAGNGRGTGEGNGIGSGSGNGNGNGNGNGTGNGNEGSRTPPPPPPSAPVGITQKVKIISKPKPGYTDAARQNQVTGVVRLRVVFTASGQVGSISPVSGLPYGLTESAIAAARGIKFEPAKKNGVPIPSQSIVEYSFTIY